MADPYRASLDHRMRSVLAQLELISSIPAVQLGKSTPATDDTKGGNRPPGDTDFAVWKERYGPPFTRDGGCRSDHARELVIDEAERELKHLRKTTRITVVEESAAVFDKRVRKLLKEGWTVKEIAIKERCSEKRVTRVAIDIEDDSEITDDDVVALSAQGYSVRGISIKLDMPKSTIHDILKRATQAA